MGVYGSTMEYISRYATLYRRLWPAMSWEGVTSVTIEAINILNTEFGLEYSRLGFVKVTIPWSNLAANAQILPILIEKRVIKYPSTRFGQRLPFPGRKDVLTTIVVFGEYVFELYAYVSQ